MRIIKSTASDDGAYGMIIIQSGTTLPDGYHQVADGVELSCGGFGTLTVEDGIVTGFTPDVAAWEQWQAEHPEPEPTLDDITALQLAVAELAETQTNDQTANELALTELAEIVLGG